MKCLAKIIMTTILALWAGSSIAQQVPIYSQYVMNGFLLNPSFAGRDGYTSVNLTVRQQWVGLEGAPATYAASFQTRVLKTSYILKSSTIKRKIVRPTKGGRVGAGAYIFNDRNGLIRRTGFQAAYAYHIPLRQALDGYPRHLAFGLGLTAYQYAIDNEGFLFKYNDPYLNNYDYSMFIPDFNFGANYTTSRFFVGFAMTNLTRGSLSIGNQNADRSQELGHYFLTTGYKLPIGRNWILEPSGFIKSSDLFLSAAQFDISARMYYKMDYWLGVSYRSGDAVIGMMGFRVDKFYFAYAMDFTLTDIRSRSYGTHELSLALKFGESARRFRWINAF
ncbi:MAG: type IX secretion system membrane protein PorP/SprF [Bacteroidales bacterium]|jgi:type IX secretion system PorP/SprF family membrane protein|nr:type IX secretion system membrane protein PorP/SprF [Bacteroidales bacterium]